MADDTNDNNPADKPTPRRRAPRKGDAPGKAAAKRASRPAASAPKKAAVTKSAPKAPVQPSPPAKPEPADRARAGLSKAADKVGGKRNAGLIAGGLAVAGTAAALLLRSSTPGKRANDNARGGKAHQPDGTDSSAQMEAMIADESMIPESTPQA